MTRQEALRTYTLNNAYAAFEDDLKGSLEVGKDADLAWFDGDPFEYRTHCVGVAIDAAPAGC